MYFNHKYFHIKRIVTLVIILFLIFPSSVSAAKESSGNADTQSSGFQWPTGPKVYSDAAIVMEASTGLILYQKDIYDKHYPASITKIMTTLLAIENCNLNETMTMSHNAEWKVDFNSSRIGLVEGESLLLRDALYGVMLESANEVSYGVGEHVAGGSIEKFSDMMNARAKELGCVNTHFVNPHGLHDDNHYTCAYDMALISQAAIKLPEFRTITGTRTYTIPATNKNVARPLANHHRFIRKTMTYDGAIGGKTGGTTEAKSTLVTYAKRDGLLLIAVVLHSDTPQHAYEDTAKILDFAFDNYSLYSINDIESTEASPYATLFKTVPAFSQNNPPDLKIDKNSNIVLPIQANYKDTKKSIEWIPVQEFHHGNNIVGKISYTYKDKYVGSTNILYYNKEFPLTNAEFEARWPNFLISPNEIFKNNEEVISSTSSTQTPAKSPKISTKAILIGFITFFIIILVGYYFLFIVIPHRRRRSAYRKKYK